MTDNYRGRAGGSGRIAADFVPTLQAHPDESRQPAACAATTDSPVESPLDARRTWGTLRSSVQRPDLGPLFVQSAALNQYIAITDTELSALQ
jgi:hypothetical protein